MQLYVNSYIQNVYYLIGVESWEFIDYYEL